jgi:hypothetical protein
MRRKLELLCELKPGEPGTEELVERFGAALVCVRHWYDPERDVELKTAEVIALRRPWQPRRRVGRMLEPRSPRRKG